MDRTHYWELIEQARDEVDATSASPEQTERTVQAFVRLLMELPPEEICDAWLRHHELMADAYTWPVWGAAYVLKGGCSDDSFEYFRNWLILQGRDAFDSVLDDPDSLVTLLPQGELDESQFSCEELSYASTEAYEQVVGEPMPEHRDVPDLAQPGVEFDFDDAAAMQARYPKLTARVG